eukprot:3255511-Heterocapsa_arctica.AAC.1
MPLVPYMLDTPPIPNPSSCCRPSPAIFLAKRFGIGRFGIPVDAFNSPANRVVKPSEACRCDH